MRFLALLIVLVPSFARALTFGVGCADGCGVEQALVGEAHPCSAVLVNDATFPVTVNALHVLVHHADGDVTIEALATPEPVLGPAPLMTTIPFNVPIEPNDAVLGSLALNVTADLAALGITFDESFGDRIAIVASVPPCHVVATTTTTVTTTTSTTTTLIELAKHPCNPHASPNSRWCR